MKKFVARPCEKPDKIVSYWLSEKATVLIIIISGFIYNGFMAAGPYFQGKLLDSLAENLPFAEILSVALMFLGSIGIIQFARYFKRFYVRRFANSTSATMRLMVYNNILSAPIRELEQSRPGEMMSRIISDVELCVEGMRKVTTEFFDTGVVLASYLFVMFTLDVRLTLLSCAFVPVAVLIAEKMKKLIYRYSAEFRVQSDINASSTLETVSHAILYRQSGLEEQSAERYTQKLEDLEKSAVRAGVAENSLQPLYKCVSILGIAFVVLFGGQNVVEGSWTIGSFSMYLTLFTMVSQRAAVAAKIFNSAQKSQISWQRLKPYLSGYSEKLSVHKLESAANLAIENLSFAYNGAENAVENISFSGQAGDIIGVTGSVASGKSALGLALTGAWAYGGSARLNGRELSELSDAQKAACISYMGHEAELFSDTIENNICMGKAVEVGSVLRDSALDEDLKLMHQTEQAQIGNAGVSLSGGQQARVALARALVSAPPLIVLDDPFSAVDTATEDAIMKRLQENYKNSIIIVLSHRLHTFASMKKIIFIERGAKPIVGTHAEMMEKCEDYASIYNMQENVGDEKYA